MFTKFSVDYMGLNPHLGGFLWIRFEVGVEGVKLPPCLKPVRIMLEALNLTRKYTRICSFRKYTF